MTDAIQKAREAKAWNCDEWPEWLHAVVDKTCEVADRLDMSSEQAHAYAALAALDAETPATPADVGERDIYEVANQLLGYVGPDTTEPLAKFLLREGEAASELADTIVRLRARLETVEAETRERCAMAAEHEGSFFAADAIRRLEPRHD